MHMSVCFSPRSNWQLNPHFYRVFQKKPNPGYNFAITSVSVHRLTIFYCLTGNVCPLKEKLCLPPHLHSVTLLPSKMHTTANIDASFSNV